MKPLRICLVSKEYPPEGRGGIANYVHLLAHGLVEAGHDVTVLSGPVADESSSPASKATSPSPRLHRVPDYRIPVPSPLRRKGPGLWDLIERSWTVDRTIARLEGLQGPFDVVEMPNVGAEALFFCLHSRAPLVIRLSTPLKLSHQFRGVPSTRIGFPLHVFLESFPVHRADLVIANSRFNAETCVGIYNIRVSELPVIHLGVEIPQIRPPLTLANEKTVRVLYVGRLHRRKGIHYLLRAIPLVVEKMPHVHFTIVGQDTRESPVESAVNLENTERITYEESFKTTTALSVQSSTTFLGHVDQATLKKHYAECDILVAPSLSESFGLMYAEAMAYGKPVVALRAGAAPEVVVHRETGLLVDPNDWTELANALITLAKSRELRLQLGKNGYERVCKEFSVQSMVGATENLYRQVIAEHQKCSISGVGYG